MPAVSRRPFADLCDGPSIPRRAFSNMIPRWPRTLSKRMSRVKDVFEPLTGSFFRRHNHAQIADIRFGKAGFYEVPQLVKKMIGIISAEKSRRIEA